MLSDSTAILVFCLLVQPAVFMVAAEPIQLQSTQNRTSLLELYTSEGCRSCPPAESWLSDLKKSPKLWHELVPVAFHVDYWDSLGWKDAFGAGQFSTRQRDYANHWRTQSVYTPGFVLNGQEWNGWFRREPLPANAPKATGILRAVSDDGRNWRLSFQLTNSGTASTCEFQAALLGFELSSAVKAGENRGRKLDHDFVVLKLAKVISQVEADTAKATLLLEPAPAAAPRLGIAVWVTVPGQLEPLQALGGWIPSSN
jgi:hypothetical protein